MPPKKAAASDGDAAPSGLTDTELRFIKAIFDNMTQKPDANWDGVASDVGLKDAKCAKERFRQMSHRHGWREQGSAAAASPRKTRGNATGTAADGKVKKTRSPRKKTIKPEAQATDGAKEDPEETEAEI